MPSAGCTSPRAEGQWGNVNSHVPPGRTSTRMLGNIQRRRSSSSVSARQTRAAGASMRTVWSTSTGSLMRRRSQSKSTTRQPSGSSTVTLRPRQYGFSGSTG